MLCFRLLLLTLPLLALALPCWSQSTATSSEQDRIVTHEEVQEAVDRQSILPIRILSYPHRAITGGMEKGLIKAEKGRYRERMRMWTEQLRQKGIEGMFGGMGEQTGFGGGLTYTVRPAGWNSLAFLARGTFAHYQEFDIKWTAARPHAQFSIETSYQWRPKENFYGLGHDSLASQHTDFALRQTWAGADLKFTLPKYFRFGAEYKLVATKALAGTNPLTPDAPDVFPGLPGMGTLLRMQSGGVYADLDFSEGEYGWTGRGHFGTSYQEGIGNSNLRYVNYEASLEGRMPVKEDRSAFVGHFTLNINREKGGSDPIPFYLRPHIGGSSTMRGFALDRFYGKNLLLMSLDYRYKIHTNFEASIFHDAGQIFDRQSQLTWFNWHRNYGVSLRVHSNYKTILRLEYGHSREGFDIHVSFGDRAPQALGGVVRYGTYRR